MAYSWLNSLGGYDIMTCDIYTPSNIPSYVDISNLNIGNNPISSASQSTVWNVSEKLRITWDIDNNSSIIRVIDVENSVNLIEGYYAGFSSTLDHINILIPIDESLEKANFYVGLHYTAYPSEYNIDQHNMTDVQRTRFYQLIKEAEPQQYNWSSVPAISGKNGILSLTQILNINDGEPVEDVTKKSNLDFSKKTKINTLINSAYEPTYKEDATKATVEYEIPEAEYQYTKLVYKKKKIPKSPSDGTAINIGADDTEVVVSGLEENSTYYFVVFTNRTKSNAYKFKTGKNAPEEGIFKIQITTTQGVKDNGFKEVIEVTRV